MFSAFFIFADLQGKHFPEKKLPEFPAPIAADTPELRRTKLWNEEYKRRAGPLCGKETTGVAAKKNPAK